MSDEVIFIPVTPAERAILRWIRTSRFRDDQDALLAFLEGEQSGDAPAPKPAEPLVLSTRPAVRVEPATVVHTVPPPAPPGIEQPAIFVGEPVVPSAIFVGDPVAPSEPETPEVEEPEPTQAETFEEPVSQSRDELPPMLIVEEVEQRRDIPDPAPAEEPDRGRNEPSRHDEVLFFNPGETVPDDVVTPPPVMEASPSVLIDDTPLDEETELLVDASTHDFAGDALANGVMEMKWGDGDPVLRTDEPPVRGWATDEPEDQTVHSDLDDDLDADLDAVGIDIPEPVAKTGGGFEDDSIPAAEVAVVEDDFGVDDDFEEEWPSDDAWQVAPVNPYTPSRVELPSLEPTVQEELTRFTEDVEDESTQDVPGGALEPDVIVYKPTIPESHLIDETARTIAPATEEVMLLNADEPFLMKVGDHMVEGENARTFLVSIMEHLLAEGIVRPEHLPVATGKSKYLLAARPLHPTGRKFVDSVLLGDLWLEADRSPADVMRSMKAILNALDVPYEVLQAPGA